MKIITVALSAFALFSAAAFAGGGPAQVQKTVAYGDLNLGTQEGAVALHDRLVAAAAEVCVADAQKGARSANQCRDMAMKKAIAEVTRKLAERLASVQ